MVDPLRISRCDSLGSRKRRGVVILLIWCELSLEAWLPFFNEINLANSERTRGPEIKNQIEKGDPVERLFPCIPTNLPLFKLSSPVPDSSSNQTFVTLIPPLLAGESLGLKTSWEEEIVESDMEKDE